MTDDGDVTDFVPVPKNKPAFDQDPHRVRELSERNLELAIGREVRAFRRQQGMTVADLAGVTGSGVVPHAPCSSASATISAVT